MALEANNVLIKSIEANNNTTVGTAMPITWKTPLDAVSVDGAQLWTDGENIYYSSDTFQYQLDKTTSTWNKKNWSGFTNLDGVYGPWTDGENIYYSLGTAQYQLDKATSTWTSKTWNGLTNFNGAYVWTDGTNIYYSFYITECFPGLQFLQSRFHYRSVCSNI